MSPIITTSPNTQEDFDYINKNLSQIRTFETGSKRSTEADSERYDLIGELGLERLAKTYAEGVSPTPTREAYEEHNWRKGQPFSVVLNHVLWHLNKYKKGENGEDHLAHAAFGLFALMEFETTHPELNDLYAYAKVTGEHGAAVRAATAESKQQWCECAECANYRRQYAIGSSHSYTTPHQEPDMHK